MIALIAAALLLTDPTATAALERETEARVLPAALAPAPAEPMGQTSDLVGVAVSVECVARADGRIEQCQILGQTHPGLGFDRAAIALLESSTTDPAAEDRAFVRTLQFTP
jgi:hypothetical protein